MASRQLRKLRKQQELLNLQKDVVDKEESDEEELATSPIVAKPRPNMFSGFAALGDMGGDDDDDDEDEQKSEDDEPAPAPATQIPANEEPAKKSKRSKKKKKKGKKADTQAPQAAAPAKENVKSAVDDEDEIDQALKELKLDNERQGGSSGSGSSSQRKPTAQLTEVLGINSHHLKDVNEMRRLFGKAMDVAQSEERSEIQQQQRAIPENMDLEMYLSARAQGGPPRGRGGSQAQQKGMFDTLLRTNPFIEGKKTWPRGAAQGLKMVRITEGTPDVVEFAFAHDKAYDEMEKEFFNLVQMYDPMQIVHFLRANPYHVSSLIQVSKVARQDQNSALAADLIERAVFTFGRVSLSEFRRKLEQGKARLDFSRPENRQFYLAGYNLIQKLILKGTYRTALEWAKLLLSLNHDDPYGISTWIHVLAIRSYEAQWFLDLCDTGIFDRPQATVGAYIRQTIPLAHLQLKNTPLAQETLIANMQQLPWLYCSLFSALNLDTPKSIWGVKPRDDDEELHTELYIHVAKDLWNTPLAMDLLKQAASSATKVDNISKLPPSPKVSLATARWIYLDNTPSLMTLVPRKMLHTASPNFDFDPLPPKEADNIFSSDVQRSPWRSGGERQQEGMRAAAERLLANIPAEQLEAAFGAGGLEALMRRMRGLPPRQAAPGGPPRAPFQATVEDGGDEDDDDEGDNWEDEMDDEDNDDFEFGLAGEWDEDGDDDEIGVGLHGDGGFWGLGGGVRNAAQQFASALAGGLGGDFMYGIPPEQYMPGAWGSDDDDDDDEMDESPGDEMPALEDPSDDEMPGLEDAGAPPATDAPSTTSRLPPGPPAGRE
ncbi:transcriptional repressor TCF25-domain-containing protein [Podospora australis]|uniref:Transcriptional repressor TCF25-domain-containing protein n=1 Tax=Podospora australis TaxID=1536484 RepID=A0AAN7AIH1_9PEZI|nr:transcriptional repressor TCF25-domain-containing protein [Podospora australis]